MTNDEKDLQSNELGKDNLSNVAGGNGDKVIQEDQTDKSITVVHPTGLINSPVKKSHICPKCNSTDVHSKKYYYKRRRVITSNKMHCGNCGHVFYT